MHWPYYDLIEGRLYMDVATTRRRSTPILAFKDAPKFAGIAEAEEWLIAKDLRGNVREPA